MKEFKQLKNKDIKSLRDELLKEQGGICPLCKTKIKEGEATLDHQHKTNAEEIGVNGAGLIRGVLCRNCNSAEGSMLSKYKRAGVYLKDYPEFLRNLADYLVQDNLPYIHPNEAPKTQKMGKRNFNKLKKMYKMKYPKRKELKYPKSGKLTKRWIDLFIEFDIEIK